MKKSLSLREAIGKTICAFANSKGGKIIVGLAEVDKLGVKGGDEPINNKYVLVGLGGDIDANRVRLTMHIGKKISLDISSLEFELEEVSSKKLMIITVPSSRIINNALYFYNGDAYIREDNHNKKLSGQEVYNICTSLSN